MVAWRPPGARRWRGGSRWLTNLITVCKQHRLQFQMVVIHFISNDWQLDSDGINCILQRNRLRWLPKWQKRNPYNSDHIKTKFQNDICLQWWTIEQRKPKFEKIKMASSNMAVKKAFRIEIPKSQIANDTEKLNNSQWYSHVLGDERSNYTKIKVSVNR